MSSCCQLHSGSDSGGKVQDLTKQRWSQSIWAASGLLLPVGWLLPAWRPFLWSVGLAAAGILCIVNAARCGRMHCHISGPVLLLGSLMTVLNAISVISLSWSLLGAAILVGVAISYVPELLVGKYVRRNPPASGANA